MSRFTNAPRGDDGLFPGPAADIQHPAARRDGGEIEHPLRSGHKVVTPSRCPTCPPVRSSVPLFGRCSVAHGVISLYVAIQWQAEREGKGTGLQTAHLGRHPLREGGRNSWQLLQNSREFRELFLTLLCQGVRLPVRYDRKQT